MNQSSLMETSRRRFIVRTVGGMAGAGVVTACAAQSATETVTGETGTPSFKLYPIGKVEVRKPVTRVRIFDQYKDALLGLAEWSHVLVFYWFDQNDTPERRRILRVHPRGNKANPLTGVFACRAPFRPNLIALSTCKILSVEGTVVNLDTIDAFDGTPVLDLKPFTPPDAPAADSVRVPSWAEEERRSLGEGGMKRASPDPSGLRSGRGS